MLPAQLFAVLLAVAGFLIGGWVYAVALPVIYLAALIPLNAAVMQRATPDRLVVALQATKWALALTLVGVAAAVQILT